MTIDHWLMIVLIITTVIATLVAPIIGAFTASRISRPRPMLETSQPQNLIHRMGGWFIRFFQSPWILPPFLILLNIFLLFSEFRRKTPVTRWTIYQISSSVAGILYGVVLFALNSVWQSIRLQSETAILQNKTDRELLDLITAVSDGSNAINKESLALTGRVLAELEESRRGKLSKLLRNTIERVFGG